MGDYKIVKWAGGDVFWVYKLNSNGNWVFCAPIADGLSKLEYFETEGEASAWVESVGGNLVSA